MTGGSKRVIFMQEGRWRWELIVDGVTVAQSPSVGYASQSECRAIADLVVSGHFRDADRRIRDPRR